MSAGPGSEDNPFLPQIRERLQKEHEASETSKRETAHFVKQIQTGSLPHEDEKP